MNSKYDNDTIHIFLTLWKTKWNLRNLRISALKFTHHATSEQIIVTQMQINERVLHLHASSLFIYDMAALRTYKYFWMLFLFSDHLQSFEVTTHL